MESIPQEAVRVAMLAAQGLLTKPMKPAAPDDILPAIKQMQYLQIDTIQAVRRSQYLVLWSRLGDFEPDWLDDLHRSGALFEYYAHSLCYLPMEDYPIFRGRILYDDRVGDGWHKWAPEHQDVIQHVRDVIETRGPVCSSDFDSEMISTGWGDVKQEKLALQHMFSTGELMVPYRVKFQRYYDLSNRVLPEWDDARALDAQAAKEALILKTVRALGIARLDWLSGYYYLLKTGLEETASKLVDEGCLRQVFVEGWDTPGYVHFDQWGLVKSCASGDLQPAHTTFLSPFDPLISDRDRTKDVFDFDYRMESFTPAKNRRYGYFCLPILHDGRLVGRLDPKAHRKQKRMEIKKIYLEPSISMTDRLVNDLKETLDDFTIWNEMDTFEITAAEPPELQEALS
ncbi:MAG: winged helix-turn-helix domain-containing protein [Brevefilum sp.]